MPLRILHCNPADFEIALTVATQECGVLYCIEIMSRGLRLL